MAVDDAILRGSNLRRTIWRLKEEVNCEVKLPELVSIIDKDLDGNGDLIIEGSHLAALNGVDGAKLIVGDSTEIVLKNHEASSFSFKAIQFKKQSKEQRNSASVVYETPRGNQSERKIKQHNALIRIINTRKDFVSLVSFEDCSFFQDVE